MGMGRDEHTYTRRERDPCAFVVLMKRHYPPSVRIPDQEGCCNCILTVAVRSIALVGSQRGHEVFV